jgi:type IV pilus assembly protein PilQ
LITTRFESAVDRIRPFQTDGMKNKSSVSIELRQAVPYCVEQTDNLLLIHFEASTIPPKSLEEADLPAWKEEAIIQADSKTPSQIKTHKKADAEISYSEVPNEYKGEKIALDFFETDIKNVFRILREVSGTNFAVDKNVTGKVTLTLDRPVPWDQVLDLVLKMNQLGQVEEGNIIRIATLETLKSEEELRRAQWDAEKKALEQKKELEPLFTEYIPINYAQASEIITHLNEIKTKDRATISVDDRTNTIIMTDVAAKLDKAKKIVMQLDKPTPQVIIEARIVEADSSFLREIGVDWSISGETDSLDCCGFGDLFGFDSAVNLPTSTGNASNGTIGINFTRITNGTLLLNAQLQANEATGDVRIISSPKILTLDNQEALISQGVEYPYLEESESGGTTVQFKKIDLKLTVIPHVTNDNRISMKVTIYKNDIAELTTEAPAINTKEAKTELLINDGETIVIGGINKTTKIDDKRGIPLLSRVPGLGWLFKSTMLDERNQELLIFITPRIFRLGQA